MVHQLAVSDTTLVDMMEILKVGELVAYWVDEMAGIKADEWDTHLVAATVL